MPAVVSGCTASLNCGTSAWTLPAETGHDGTYAQQGSTPQLVFAYDEYTAVVMSMRTGAGRHGTHDRGLAKQHTIRSSRCSGEREKDSPSRLRELRAPRYQDRFGGPLHLET